jgi:sigma-E factor negative regulatory protein RseA
MTEQEQERLSALVDDQLDRSDIQITLGRLAADAGQQATWSRYHLIGDAMRRETGPLVDTSLAERISRGIQDEPVVFAPGSLKRPAAKWFRPAAGIAVAASVAALALTVAPQFINPEQGILSPPTVAVNPAPPVQHLYVAEDGTRWELLGKPKVESRLNSYLVNHQEYAPAGNMKGIMPFATFVSYDAGQ